MSHEVFAVELAETQPQVNRGDGVLVIDDSTLDKPYATVIDLVTRRWPGKHHAVVQGINLVTLLWTDGDRHIPCDYCVYHRADGATKTGHFATTILTAMNAAFLHDVWRLIAGTAVWKTSNWCSPVGGFG